MARLASKDEQLIERCLKDMSGLPPAVKQELAMRIWKSLLKMKQLLCLLFLSFINFACYCQVFVNGGLEGTPTLFSSMLPSGWQRVPFTDPNCLATGAGFDSPDLTSLNGPDPLNGISGNPFSGSTFISGLRSGDQEDQFQEGIMQTVSGFVIGHSYRIGFMQSVVKQINCLDQSGSWAVYADTTLLGIVPPTLSLAPFNSTSFIWEPRSISFTATSVTHTIKFLPADDDENLSLSDTDNTGALRMGIDRIYLEKLPCNLAFDLGQDTIICVGATLDLSVPVDNATFLWSNGSSDSGITVYETGRYSVKVTSAECIVWDSIKVSVFSMPEIDLGNDSVLCIGDQLALGFSLEGAVYEWQDGSSNSGFTAMQTGDYWVTVSQNGCTARDEIRLEFIDCTPELVMPNIFTPNQDGINDTFSPIQFANIKAMKATVFNRWGKVVFETESLNIGWDGNAFNGKQVPTGLYFYQIEYEGLRSGPYLLKGWIEVLN